MAANSWWSLCGVQGVLCWSNLILWPENIHKLIAVRLDNYQDVPSIEVKAWPPTSDWICMTLSTAAAISLSGTCPPW